VPDTPAARTFLKGSVYELADGADYNAGSPNHDRPFYFLEIRIPINRLDLSAKQGLIRDFTRVVLEAEGSDNRPENARRVWVTINELRAEAWGIGGHTDWLRDYTTALEEVEITRRPPDPKASTIPSSNRFAVTPAASDLASGEADHECGG
jgi:phenylpyruvate tautomerase PptA (4-oxalocrotonate tautomerase family)